ncbi:MAG: VIT and VWA domain-containing protein [Gammaproteobacteria bacterium]|nr:VIT and VWA domain-containing protein [Gammaproteobacteria bacterium]
MKSIKSLTRLLALPAIALLSGLLFTGLSQAAGLLTPANGSLADLEIREHHVNVVIEDGYAITTVNQVFHNPHGQDLEAIYSFPVPEKAAVEEFTVWIDGQPVSGEVLEKMQARQVYESEKSAGRDAGLMEKDAYRTFDTRVSPVRAGQDTRIRFAYIQPTHVDTGMGRYVYPLEDGGVDEEKLAFWTANETVQEKFSFKLELKSTYPIDALRLPHHPQATIAQQDAGRWTVDLTSKAVSVVEEEGATIQGGQAAYSLDKDLVVYWRHQAGLPGSVDLVTYKPAGNKRGSFMLTLTPGDDLQPIHEGSDWIFVLDISGSMKGKFTTLADGVQQALGKMRPNDRFRIVLFNESASELTPGYINASAENVQHYSQALLQVQPGSGTNLYSGITRALGSIEADRTSAIVLVTDGVANVGETRQRKFLELIRSKDIRLFTFIMGNSANRPLLQALTGASNGFAISVSNSDDIVGRILEASSKVTHESLHGVNLSIRGIKTADLTPKTIGSLYRGQQLVVFGHYWGDGIADIKLSGKISGQIKDYSTQIEFPASSSRNPELERLWAFAAIEDMQAEIEDFGEDADLEQAIADLSIEYGLVTDYTSMVVLREEAFQSHGIQRQNKQRLQVEAQAQQQRATQPSTSNRVDNAQPMFKSNRPSHSGGGGGSFHGGIIALMIVLLGLKRVKGGTGRKAA